jgi:hypothetical protein
MNAGVNHMVNKEGTTANILSAQSIQNVLKIVKNDFFHQNNYFGLIK